jgi:hypothetical protein
MQRCTANPPPGISLFYYATCGFVGADNEEPGQALRLLHFQAAENYVVNQADMEMALVPMRLAGWDVASLPAELQPYVLHFKAVLALRWVVRKACSAWVQDIMCMLVFDVCYRLGSSVLHQATILLTRQPLLACVQHPRLGSASQTSKCLSVACTRKVNGSLSNTALLDVRSHTSAVLRVLCCWNMCVLCWLLAGSHPLAAGQCQLLSTSCCSCCQQ